MSINLKDYIASGVVEMYALGVLSDSERTEFEQRILMYPELISELKHVQGALGIYSKAHAINPRPELRSEILLNALKNGNSLNGNSTQKNTEKNHSLTYKYLIAASLAALAISTFASWFFYSRWEDSEERFSQLLKEKNQLAQNYNVVKDGFDKTVYDMLVMRDAHSLVINLHAVDSNLNFLARIYWNQLSHDLFIDVLNLPEPEQEHQYQLWGIKNGQTYNAGLFDAHEFTGVQRMNEVANADQWTVTIEPKGGSQLPNLEKLILRSSER